LHEQIKQSIKIPQLRAINFIAYSLHHFLSVYFYSWLLIAAALVFTPYMLYVLYKEKRTGWISAFLILIILPLIVILVLPIETTLFLMLSNIPLALFFLYCFILRFEVNSWIREKNAKEQWLAQKKKSEEELNTFMDHLKK
jgi:predicted neutral ceramidase superfamily lipid hydrolase